MVASAYITSVGMPSLRRADVTISPFITLKNVGTSKAADMHGYIKDRDTGQLLSPRAYVGSSVGIGGYKTLHLSSFPMPNKNLRWEIVAGHSYPMPNRYSVPTVEIDEIIGILKYLAATRPDVYNSIASHLNVGDTPSWPSDARWYVFEYWERYYGYHGGFE